MFIISCSKNLTFTRKQLQNSYQNSAYSTTPIVAASETASATGNAFKPRYALPFLAKSKVWPYKNSRLRRFYGLRSRRLQRGGLFRRFVLVSTTRKWTLARRFIRPVRRRAGGSLGGSGGGGGATAYGRPSKRRYRQAFYTKQQLRAFHGKLKETAFRKLFQTYRSTVSKRNSSFFAALESRLDRVLFRRRVLPTVFACHQLIHHHGVHVNQTLNLPASSTVGSLEFSPNAVVRVGDIVSLPVKTWKSFYWDLYCRVYYRRWGVYVLRRRQYTQLKAKQRLLFLGKPLSLLDLVDFSGNVYTPGITSGDSDVSTESTTNSLYGKSSEILETSDNWITYDRQIDSSETASISKYQHLRQLQKRYIAASLFGPSNLRRPLNEFTSDDQVSTSQASSVALRRFRRQRQLKKERSRKIPRLKAVHWYVPSYLHRDFRTLRAVRISSPALEDIHHSFQVSLAKVHSFYRSRGY